MPILRTLLVLDLSLDIVDGIARLDVERDRLAREGLHEYLHGCTANRTDSRSSDHITLSKNISRLTIKSSPHRQFHAGKI